MRRVLEDDSHTVDVGANSGRILKHLIRLAPEGEHDAFEPQPNMTALLTQQFGSYPNVNIHCKALGARPRIVNFTTYENAPTLSTFYPRSDLEAYLPKCIEVEVTTLDTAISSRSLDFAKVDVEGFELEVFQGAQRRLSQDKPYMVFETNQAALQAAGTTCGDLIGFLVDECSLAVYSLHDWLAGKEPLSKDEFENRVNLGFENDFLAAHPDSHRATPVRGQQ